MGSSQQPILWAWVSAEELNTKEEVNRKTPLHSRRPALNLICVESEAVFFIF